MGRRSALAVVAPTSGFLWQLRWGARRPNCLQIAHHHSLEYDGLWLPSTKVGHLAVPPARAVAAHVRVPEARPATCLSCARGWVESGCLLEPKRWRFRTVRQRFGRQRFGRRRCIPPPFFFRARLFREGFGGVGKTVGPRLFRGGFGGGRSVWVRDRRLRLFVREPGVRLPSMRYAVIILARHILMLDLLRIYYTPHLIQAVLAQLIIAVPS